MKFLYLLILFCILISINFCSNNKETPSRVYMPDMYYSDAYEPYSEPYPEYNNQKNIKRCYPTIFNKETSSLLPEKNTIPKDDLYDKEAYLIHKNGFEYAKNINISSIRNKNNFYEIINEGKKLYKINCAICHGDNGDGQGPLAKNDKITGIPNYKDRELSVGSVYYVITYGKNNMGSYSSQLNKQDRWKISEYVIFIINKK